MLELFRRHLKKTYIFFRSVTNTSITDSWILKRKRNSILSFFLTDTSQLEFPITQFQNTFSQYSATAIITNYCHCYYYYLIFYGPLRSPHTFTE